jgi:hypothetical protein
MMQTYRSHGALGAGCEPHRVCYEIGTKRAKKGIVKVEQPPLCLSTVFLCTSRHFSAHLLFKAFTADPSTVEVAGDLGCNPSPVAAAFQELAAAHMLVLQPGTGEVLTANPPAQLEEQFKKPNAHTSLEIVGIIRDEHRRIL